MFYYIDLECTQCVECATLSGGEVKHQQAARSVCQWR